MKKSASCGIIAPGDVCGVEGNGELTDVFDDAHSFVIKSTAPCLVGGDKWGTEDAIGAKPVAPILVNNPSEDETGGYETALAEYINGLAAWDAALETERVKYDRIAFSGQVPVNFTGVVEGSYLIPVRVADGSIDVTATSDTSFEDYGQSVGKVWKLLDDGRAWVAVKI